MSLQTIRNVENIESHVYALHTCVCKMQRDVSRKEDQGERRARCIYERIVKEGRNYPGGKAKSVPVGSRFKLQPGRWWAPDHLDPLFHSKLVLPQGTRYVRLRIFSLATENKGHGRPFLLSLLWPSITGEKLLGAYSGPGTTGRNENVERRVPTKIFQPFLAHDHTNCFNCKGNVTTPRKIGP